MGLSYPPSLLAELSPIRRALAYDPQPLGLWPARAAVAADFRRRGIVISADRVALTSSTSEAYALLFKLFCDAGDAMLVPRPSYPLFEHLTRLESVTAVPYDLEYHGTWRIDLDSVRRAAGPRVKALLIVSPNNPTGSFLHRDDLAALSELSAAHGWPIIGDEVFADYGLDPAPSATHVMAASEVLTFSLGGLSKSAGLPQVKLGWIGFGGPAAKVDEALAAYEIVADTYLSVSTPVQVGGAVADRAGRAGARADSGARAGQPGDAAHAGRRVPGGQRAAGRRRLVGGPAGARGSLRRGAGPRTARQGRGARASGILLRFSTRGLHRGEPAADRRRCSSRR